MSTIGTNLSRDEAVARIKAKRAFMLNLAVYVVVNAVLVLIWFATRGDGDPFWPIWPIGFWGIGVLGQAWHAYRPVPRAISTAAIEREMRRHS
jgi:hypothetical protein